MTAFRSCAASSTPCGSPAGTGDYRSVVLPRRARPDRDARRHAVTQAEMDAPRGMHDDFFAEYPATPEEAPASEQLDRHLLLTWVLAVSEADVLPVAREADAMYH